MSVLKYLPTLLSQYEYQVKRYMWKVPEDLWSDTAVTWVVSIYFCVFFCQLGLFLGKMREIHIPLISNFTAHRVAILPVALEKLY